MEKYEYLFPSLLRARNKATAEKRARQKAKTFLGCRMRWVNDSRLEPIGGVEYRVVKFEGIAESTPEEIMQRLLW